VISCQENITRRESGELLEDLEDLEHVSGTLTEPEEMYTAVTDEQLRSWGFTDDDGVFKDEL
jgi:hypothetical protein